jgi:AcrR family transcriptional regulator
LDPQIDDAIVRAATAMLLEHGIQRMTVPGVATAAGVAKTTVYRRHATPLALVLAAIGRFNAEIPDVDTGDAPADLVTVLEQARRRIDPTMTATALLEAQTHPEVLEVARRRMIGPAVERSGGCCGPVSLAGNCAPTWTSRSPPTPSSAASSRTPSSAAAPGRSGRSGPSRRSGLG